MSGEIRFFFSSRRRHTRWTGDWSSDVCSSDLEVLAAARVPLGGREYLAPLLLRVDGAFHPGHEVTSRSEERRVGKKGDLGGWRQYKNNKINKAVVNHQIGNDEIYVQSRDALMR